MVAQFIDPAGAGLAHLAPVRGERRAYGRFSVLGWELIRKRLMRLVRLAIFDKTAVENTISPAVFLVDAVGFLHNIYRSCVL